MKKSLIILLLWSTPLLAEKQEIAIQYDDMDRIPSEEEFKELCFKNIEFIVSQLDELNTYKLFQQDPPALKNVLQVIKANKSTDKTIAILKLIGAFLPMVSPNASVVSLIDAFGSMEDALETASNGSAALNAKKNFPQQISQAIENASETLQNKIKEFFYAYSSTQKIDPQKIKELLSSLKEYFTNHKEFINLLGSLYTKITPEKKLEIWGLLLQIDHKTKHLRENTFLHLENDNGTETKEQLVQEMAHKARSFLSAISKKDLTHKHPLKVSKTPSNVTVYSHVPSIDSSSSHKKAIHIDSLRLLNEISGMKTSFSKICAYFSDEKECAQKLTSMVTSAKWFSKHFPHAVYK